MGLDCSHDAFHGAYSAFNLLRKEVANAVGGSYPPHDNRELDGDMWYIDGDTYTAESHPGLFAFLSHSDCDGEFTADECTQVANDLEPLIALLPTEGRGHFQGGYASVLRKFVDGCRLAASKNESLLFV